MFLDQLRCAPDGTYLLRNTCTRAVLASVTETAFTAAARRRGLLGRDGLSAGHALVLAPCAAIHTSFMRFPIDVIFVARDGQVLKVCPEVPSWRLRFAWGADATIELPAGSLASSATEVGHRLELLPRA